LHDREFTGHSPLLRKRERITDDLNDRSQSDIIARRSYDKVEQSGLNDAISREISQKEHIGGHIETNPPAFSRLKEYLTKAVPSNLHKPAHV
jgi:hypothetical protein